MNQSGKEPEKGQENLGKWVAPLSSLELDEFCRRWIPMIYNVNPGNPKYVACCLELVCLLTDKTEKTVKNWYYSTQKVPNDIKKFLGAVDALWRVSVLVEQIAAKPQKKED